MLNAKDSCAFNTLTHLTMNLRPQFSKKLSSHNVKNLTRVQLLSETRQFL